MEKETYEFVNALEIFDDNNNGYIYGIQYLDIDGNILDCEWFRTEYERNLAIPKGCTKKYY